MGVVRDVTIDQLTQAVQGISSAGMTDTTGQDIKDSIDALDMTAGTLGKDSSLQDIKDSIVALANAVKPDASDIPYDASLSVKGKIDEINDLGYKPKNYSTSVGIDNMHGNDYNGLYWMSKTNWSDMPQGSYGYLEVCGNLQKFYPYGGTGLAELYIRMYANSAWNTWKRVQSTSNASITRQSGVSSTTPIPTITRRGNVVIIHFAQQFPAGTYYQLYNVTPLPIGSQHAMLYMGGNKDLITLLTDGTMRFNNSKTFSSSTYVIGQLVYLTDE